MYEKYEEVAWEYMNEFRKITPALLMRRLKLRFDVAEKICCKVHLRRNREARALAQGLENYGFDAQLQRVARKNLEKFKGKKKNG